MDNVFFSFSIIDEIASEKRGCGKGKGVVGKVGR